MSHQQKMAKKETEGAGGAELKCWQGHRSTWTVPRHRAPGKALLLHSPGLPRRAVGGPSRHQGQQPGRKASAPVLLMRDLKIGAPLGTGSLGPAWSPHTPLHSVCKSRVELCPDSTIRLYRGFP